MTDPIQEAVLIERGLYEQVVEALEDMISLAGGVHDDDAWFGERREAEKRIAVAESVLAKLKEGKP